MDAMLWSLPKKRAQKATIIRCFLLRNCKESLKFLFLQFEMSSKFKFFPEAPRDNPELEDILFDPLDPENYVQQSYRPIALIGHGAFSTVLECTKIETRQRVAVKVINKLRIKKSSLQMVVQEANFLKRLVHSNVVGFIEQRESLTKVYIITKLVSGRSLKQIIETEQLNSSKIRQIIKQLCEGLNYIHSQNIIHRDLKPDNIIVESLSDTKCQLKIIDFGLSFQKNQEILITHKNCGTLLFMAPEIVFGQQYNQKVDMWSLGVIQYVLFTQGQHPISCDDDSRQTYLEKASNFDFEKLEYPGTMDKQAINFFFKCTAKQPENRMSARQSLEHPWINNNSELGLPRTMDDLIKEIERLKNFEYKFKAILLLMRIIEKSPKKIQDRQDGVKEFVITKKTSLSKFRLNLLSQEQSNAESSSEQNAPCQMDQIDLSPIRDRQRSDQLGMKPVSLNLMKRNYSLHMNAQIKNVQVTPPIKEVPILSHRQQLSLQNIQDYEIKPYKTNRFQKSLNYLTESEDEKSFKSWHSDPKIQLPALNQTNKSKFWKIANKNEGTLPKVNRRKPLNV